MFLYYIYNFIFGPVNGYWVGAVVMRHIGGGTVESSDGARMWLQGISPPLEEKPLGLVVGAEKVSCYESYNMFGLTFALGCGMLSLE